MKKTLVILGVLFSLASSAQQVAKGLTASNGEFIGFYEYKPTDYNTSTKYPVIIFLHGIGERGNGTTDLPRVLGNGTPNNIQNGHTMRFFWNGKWETFLVLTPQLDPKYGWWPNFYVDEMINYATRNLSIDPNRIFLTGLSLGGGGVWSYAISSLANAQKFAAIGVSCGTCQNGDWSNIAKANLPTWAWHAADDGTVSAGCSNGAIQTINSYNPAVKPYLTIWPTGQHWIWGKVYNTDYEAQHPNIYEWFLGQNKSLPVNKRPVADAGADQTISALTGIATLNASGSRDDDGNIVQYVWSKVSGPSFGSISATAMVSVGNTTVVTGLSEPGQYVYELRAIDNRADWTVDQVTINVVSTPVTDPVGNKAPVARAGNDVSVTLPTNSASLNGSGSSDPDGSISSYTWSKVSGPANGTLNNANSAQASLTNLEQGTYTYRLTVKDNNNATNTDDINITVGAAGSAPGGQIANAGSDITVSLPTTSTTLNGSGSSDPGGAIKQYEWTKVNGPSQYSIVNTKSASTSLTGLVQGTYEFKLTVWDHNWAPTSDLVTVTVNTGSGSGGGGTGNGAANAGADFSVTLPNSGTLNGSASSDPGGAIKQFEWSWVNGPSQYTIANNKSATTSLTNLVAGTYQFKLTVWDHNWVPTSDLVTVTVSGSGSGGGGSTGNGIANAGADFSVSLPNSGTLNGSASSDPGGSIKAYEWTKVSGPSQFSIANTKAASTSLSNLAAGTYIFKLTVWDHNWVPVSDEVVVTAQSGSGGGSGGVPGRIPNAGADIYLTLPTNNTTLNGSASSDPGGTIKGYEWVKVNGPSQFSIANPKSATTSVSNLVEGIYQFKLTVWDHNWAPTSDTVDVVVKGSGSDAPPTKWANAGQDIYITLPINSTTLNGYASADPNGGGELKGYEWKKVSGPSQYSITNSKAQATTVTNLAQGNYVFELTVWNKDWIPATDRVNVVVMSGATSSAALTTSDAIMSAKTEGAPVAQNKLSVYPNPAHGMINVQLVSEESGKTVINVYDVSGRNVQSLSFEKAASLQQRSLNVTQLAPGVYHLEVIIGNKTKMITKFIKQ